MMKKRSFVLLLCLCFGKIAIAQKVDKDNTIQADRPIQACPVVQPQAKNGSKPNPELLKKIIRCNKGELAASKGYDGAVTVDVSAVQVGTPRKWAYNRDTGNGTNATWVYPVKATYTVKTYYRKRIAVEENWIRILNFYVDGFGEWAIGSQESVKAATLKDLTYP